MNKGLVLEFTKMHGAGNDFIVIDNRFFRFSVHDLSHIAARLCPRRLSVGADGLLALDVRESEDVDYRMRYFNADGSLGEMCGNGARCLAAFAREAGVESEPLIFETGAGTYRAYVSTEDPAAVRLIMPAPTHVDTGFAQIDVDGGPRLDLAFMMTGVPHAVWFGENVDDVPVEHWGMLVRNDACFRDTSGTNVDFVHVAGSDGQVILHVRSYERGVEAETLACGTGAVSALVAAFESGRITSREAWVRMPGGELRVGYVDESGEMYLEGPAVTSFRGSAVL